MDLVGGAVIEWRLNRDDWDLDTLMPSNNTDIKINMTERILI